MVEACSGRQAGAGIDCSPMIARLELFELESHTNCGSVDRSGLIEIDPETMKIIDHIYDDPRYSISHTAKMDWQPDHLRCVAISINQKYKNAYLNREGIGRIVYGRSDLMCPSFHPKTGLVRTLIDGKISLFDEDMVITKSTPFSFVQGDIICEEEPERTRGDHWTWQGGKCGRINQDYEIIVAMKYPYEDVPK